MHRMLAIDDDATVTNVLQRGLSYEGFTIHLRGARVARHGTAAPPRIRPSRGDAVRWAHARYRIPAGAPRATRARMLFPLLIAAARDRSEICSPYFVPDESMRRELIRAARRGVAVHIIVPGRYNDQRLVRWTSRRHYGELLRGGAEIHEYDPVMTHAKILIVDGVWCVLGSTNFDNRSFGRWSPTVNATADRFRIHCRTASPRTHGSTAR